MPASIFFTVAEIRPITAEQTRPLRHAVLRPHQPVSALAYRGDDTHDTLHVGAFAGHEIIGVASMYREGEPGAWRLRGMAVAPGLQRTGIGRALFEACVAHARARGGTTMWFNARTPAIEFYRRMGCEVRGEVFELPDIGPHVVMWRRL